MPRNITLRIPFVLDKRSAIGGNDALAIPGGFEEFGFL